MRPEGRIKLGYYPTPENVVNEIGGLLQFPPHGAVILDPCCGEGLAVQQLAKGNNTKTYGVELDQARSAQARKRLDNLLAGDYQQARITKAAFSLLWLNPPYDSNDGKRLEWVFLKNTAGYLREGGVLVYIIPQKRFGDQIARYLTAYFEQHWLWRFPDGEFEAFGQMVVLAIKRKTIGRAEIPPELTSIPTRELPVLGQSLASYVVPAAKPVSVFRSTELDPAELEAEITKSPLWERINFHSDKTGQKCQTPLPLHRGHLGLLLASGKLDGLQGTNGNLHLVRGKISKVQTTSEVVNEDGSRETHILDSFRVAVKLLTPDGAIRVLA